MLGRKGNNKKVSKKDIFKLRDQFNAEVQIYKDNEETLNNLKNTGLSATTGPWYNKKHSDIGKEILRLGQEMRAFHKKWKTGGHLSLDDKGKLLYSAGNAPGGAYRQLQMALQRYNALDKELIDLNQRYGKTRQSVLTIQE